MMGRLQLLLMDWCPPETGPSTQVLSIPSFCRVRPYLVVGEIRMGLSQQRLTSQWELDHPVVILSHFFSQVEWGSSILDRVDFQVRFGIWSALPMATLLRWNQWEKMGGKSGERASPGGGKSPRSGSSPFWCCRHNRHNSISPNQLTKWSDPPSKILVDYHIALDYFIYFVDVGLIPSSSQWYLIPLIETIWFPFLDPWLLRRLRSWGLYPIHGSKSWIPDLRRVKPYIFACQAHEYHVLNMIFTEISMNHIHHRLPQPWYWADHFRLTVIQFPSTMTDLSGFRFPDTGRYGKNRRT